MDTRSKQLADSFILTERDIRLKFYKVAVALWKFKELNDTQYKNSEILKELSDTKIFLVSKLNLFNQLTLNGHIQQLSYKSGSKEEKHYISLLGYSNGDVDSLSNVDRDQLIMDINRLKEEKRQLEKKCKRLFINLKKFLSKEEVRENDVQIYIRVLKNSKNYLPMKD